MVKANTEEEETAKGGISDRPNTRDPKVYYWFRSGREESHDMEQQRQSEAGRESSNNYVIKKVEFSMQALLNEYFSEGGRRSV